MRQFKDLLVNDITVLVILALTLATLSAEFNMFDRFYHFATKHNYLLLGELASLMSMLSAAFIFLGVKQWLEVKKLQTEINIISRDRDEAWERARDLVMRDELTGVLNRKGLMDALADSLMRARRSHCKTALLLVDIDNFRGINDLYGYDRGDKLLERFCQRLHNIVRQTDYSGRVAGNQFGFVLNHLAEDADAARVAKKVNSALKKPLLIEGHRITITCSIGIASAQEDTDATALFQNADQALQQVKTHGRGGYKFFTNLSPDEMNNQLLFAQELKASTTNGELEAWYQPQYDLNTLQLIGFEALARWNHPVRGLLVPGEFLGLAEQTELISVVGESIIEQSCRFLAEATRLAERPLRVSVNVSPMHLNDKTLVDFIKTMLKTYDLAPTSLTLEVTESLLIQEQKEENFAILKDLKKLGINIALDDFGTGYSAMSYLQEYPFSSIKMDRSFIYNAHKEGRDLLLVKLILGIAEQLSIDVIAEGIETEEHLEILRDLGCTYGQGYLFSRPISSETAIQLLSTDDQETEPQGPSPLLSGSDNTA